ncbi:MAG: hypothetical protein IJJ23_07350, partial [Clostridia bacterium]|nr:hypothetical protein [Clostridia bacterium]
MKTLTKKTISTIALILAMALSFGALAEGTDSQAPAVNGAAELPQAETPAQDSALPADDALNEALSEALAALKAARATAKEEALCRELDSYVAAGQLTQEQADLILAYYREHGSLRLNNRRNVSSERSHGQSRGTKAGSSRGSRSKGAMTTPSSVDPNGAV